MNLFIVSLVEIVKVGGNNNKRNISTHLSKINTLPINDTRLVLCVI